MTQALAPIITPPIVEGEIADNPLRESRLNDSRDFRPEWDVAGLNAWVSKALLHDISRVAGKREPDPGQLIPVLLSPGGYGKTHLFGRLAYELKDRAFFVFVGAIPDPMRPLEHIRWNVVEALFRSPGGQSSVLAKALASLFRGSMVEYIRQFPPGDALRYQEILRQLHDGNDAALKIAQSVRNLRAFQILANSTAEAMPNVNAAVVRALVLGWSPQQHLARQWLRGEGLPEEDAKLLGLDEQSPAPLHVLQGVAAILQYKVPMVICCDQLDAIVPYPDAPRVLADQMMQLLAAVPCQYTALSCLEGDWKTIMGGQTLEAFKQRTQTFNLDFLTDEQAVVLLGKRLENWPQRKAGADAVWPFNRAAVQEYVREAQPPPRIFIRRCAAELDRWNGDEIMLASVAPGASTGIGAVRGNDLALQALFQKEWEKELEAVRGNPQRSPDHIEEARLYKALKEIIILANHAKGALGGLHVENCEFEMLASTQSNPKYGLRATVKNSRNAVSLIIAASKVFGGPRLVPFVKDLIEAADKSDGILLLHIRTAFAMSFVAKKMVESARAIGRLVVYAAEDHPEVFEILECALSMLEQAHSSDLVLGTTPITYEQCQNLILSTKVIESLDFFTALGSWNAQPEEAGVALVPKGTAQSGNGEKSSVAPRPNPDARRSIPASVRAARLAVLAKERQPAAPTGPTYAGTVTPEETAWAAEKLERAASKLTGWGQQVKAESFAIGPSFVRLNVRPVGSKTSFKRVCDRAGDLKTQLGLEIEPIIESHSYFFTIDIQRPQRQVVTLDETFAQIPKNKENHAIFPLGLGLSGRAQWIDLGEATDCHLLLAGGAGSGKSEFLRAIVTCLARQLGPEQIQFLLSDTARIPFKFKGISPYFKSPVAHDFDATLAILRETEHEISRRYSLLQKLSMPEVAKLESTQASLAPRLVVILDEFAGLMEQKDASKLLTGLLKKVGAMPRALGIHLILATQRPDSAIVPTAVRSNLPGKIAFAVDSEQKSKLLIESPSAAYLLGKGDLLYKRGGSLTRSQSPLASQEELERTLRVG